MTSDRKGKISGARVKVLEKLAATDGWIRHDDFHSEPPKNAQGMRRPRLGRKLRGLPYTATFAPLIAMGLIVETRDQFQRRSFQITPAGRKALRGEE